MEELDPVAPAAVPGDRRPDVGHAGADAAPPWAAAVAPLEQVPDALVVLDGELRVVWGNARLGPALGAGDLPLVGRRLWDAVPRLAGTPVERAVRGALAEGRPHTIDRVASPGDGWFAMRATPAAPGVVVHFRDIGAVVAAERMLQDETRRYRYLVEHASDAVLVLGKDGTIRFASPAIPPMTGEPRSAVEGRRWTDFVHPDDVPALQASFARALATPGLPPTVVRARVRSADGGWRVAEAAGQIVRPARDAGDAERPEPPSRAEGGDGSVRWRGVVDLRSEERRDDARAAADEPTAIVTVRDVTERAAAEEALRASEARYRGLLEQLGDGIALLDAADGRLLIVSERLCEMTGYTRAELLGMRVLDLVADAPAVDLPERLERLARGETLLTRRRLRRKDGTLLSSELSTRRIGSRVQAVVRDVTERELFEEHRRAVQKLEALGLLAGSVAHDFNNFLVAIQGNVELALADLHAVPGGGGIRAELEDIREVARRAAGLTRQLLSFSRKQARPPATFPLGDAVMGIEQMLRLLLRPSVELVVRGVAECRSVRADLGQMEQVVMNLVVNARDAMRDGGVVTITLSSRPLATPIVTGLTDERIPPGDYVVLAVADTGTGMSRETASRVFEPLFTTKAAGTGTGLGLWTVHAIVGQAGGHVAVDSTPGVGTTFQVWLPAADAPHDADAAGRDRMSRSPAPIPSRAGRPS